MLFERKISAIDVDKLTLNVAKIIIGVLCILGVYGYPKIGIPLVVFLFVVLLIGVLVECNQNSSTS